LECLRGLDPCRLSGQRQAGAELVASATQSVESTDGARSAGVEVPLDSGTHVPGVMSAQEEDRDMGGTRCRWKRRGDGGSQEFD
jgi:hypothetical protein